MATDACERWFRRVHWVMVVPGLIYMMYGSVWNLLNNYLYNPLTFYVDTAHLQWNTTFPAVTLCQVVNTETIAELSESYFGELRDPLVDSLVTDIAFYGGACYACDQCLAESGSLDCGALRNFSDILHRYRAPCEALLSDCHWQSQPLDCCLLFRPLDTEFGRCYGANAANAAPVPPGTPVPPKLVSNRVTGPGGLHFRVLEDVQLYLHDEYSVPHTYVERTLRETVLWGMRKEIVVRTIEMQNRESVHDLPIERRNCRFPSEIADHDGQLYSFYSFSSCAVECFARTQRDYCNCTHHLMPRPLHHETPPSSICSFEGLACLTEHSVEIAHARKQCPCLSSCVEPEYFVVHKTENDFAADTEDGLVTVRLLSLPYERFVRNIAKTDMDLFIALGGLIGLFFGASLLTAIDFLLNLCYLTAFRARCNRRSVTMPTRRTFRRKRLSGAGASGTWRPIQVTIGPETGSTGAATGQPGT
ncbi:sodium channel protein Nach-like [Anopheles bellator]|uniref:sodium channel protein Nach-like n=1 Tax=Anopheles bellator TaxID=139047 RepID=UPI00264A27F1|nr:sodium channel protein Nach-like [Anopheles bellator]